MAKINVAVLRGGPSDEYDVSIQTGGAVLSHLADDKYSVRDILIDKNGIWHAHGLPTDPGRAFRGIDAAFIALHGEYGEGGEVQVILETHAMPYIGSGVFGSRIAMDKGRTRAHLSPIEGIKAPSHVIISDSDTDLDFSKISADVFNRFGPPYIIKPLRGGSSLGVRVVQSVQEVPEVLKEMFQEYESVILEQFIKGKEGTAGVLEKFRGEEIYPLPPIEIRVPKGSSFWDYTAKYDGITEEICPGNFTEEEKRIMQNAAVEVHRQLGLRHYSRSDFIVAPSGIYFLEVNTLPGLTPTSLLPKAVDAVGMTFPDFLDHLVALALKK